MKTKRKIIFKDFAPKTEEENKKIKKFIEEVKKEKIDMSKFRLIGPDGNEEEIFKDYD